MSGYIRRGARSNNEMRKVTIETNFLPHAEGSCFIKIGNTHVVCTATVADKQLPHFLRDSGHGWITAEYGMLPRATSSRSQREAAKGRVDGRTQEIQRLIGRSLRAVVNLKELGERQITVDCDVIRADGGTRTASITGGYVAMFMAMKKLMENGRIKSMPIKEQVAAVSCGIINGTPLLDIEYVEDAQAEVDANYVLSGNGGIVEIQVSGEKRSFSPSEYSIMYELACKGVNELLAAQNQALLNISSLSNG